MKRIVICCLILSAALMLITGCKKKQEPAVAAGVQEKKPAPEITVNPLKNAPLKLSSLKGKVVLLNFWATWCPPCRDEIPSMMKLNTAMAGKPFQMVSVSIDEGGVPGGQDLWYNRRAGVLSYRQERHPGQKGHRSAGLGCTRDTRLYRRFDEIGEPLAHAFTGSNVFRRIHRRSALVSFALRSAADPVLYHLHHRPLLCRSAE
jgi:hypothetical protein